ncbi:integumentary mucin C.1-like [Ornithodoros turicata]|uniref:integumentary mucin C.1-like n=1 Tax=Ornithodoros turicata TaxID=34597 RepID=UPI0031397562
MDPSGGLKSIDCSSAGTSTTTEDDYLTKSHELSSDEGTPTTTSSMQTTTKSTPTVTTQAEPDLSETSQTSSTSSTTSTSTTSTSTTSTSTTSTSTTSTSTTSTSTASTSTTSTSTSTTSAKPPPPTSAPYKPGDFLLCSVTSGMADHLPKDGLCNVIFFSLITTNTSVMFSSMRVIALNRIRRYVAASRRTQCGLDFPFNTIVEHRNNIGSSSMLQAIREIGAPLSGVLTAKVGPNWDERSEATSVLLRWCREKRIRVTDGVYSLAWDGFTVKVADDLVTTKEKVCAARSTGFQGHWAVFALERADDYSCGHSKLSYTDIL